MINIDAHRAASLWADGMTMKEMAVYFDINAKSLSRIIQKHRVLFPYRKTEGTPNTNVPDAEALLEMLKTRSLKEIAEQYSVTRNVIDGRIRRYHERARINGQIIQRAAQVASMPIAEQKPLPADRVVRKTSGGAFVTLQRIPSIDGAI